MPRLIVSTKAFGNPGAPLLKERQTVEAPGSVFEVAQGGVRRWARRISPEPLVSNTQVEPRKLCQDASLTLRRWHYTTHRDPQAGGTKEGVSVEVVRVRPVC